MRLAPGYLEAANNLAWLLATAADRQLREPAEAIRLVEAAALESSDPDMLDTLAAAYAAAGRFQEANATALRAAGRADESGAPTLAGDFRERAALYRAGKPYVEPVSSAASPIQR
jgi:spermidine synthase